MARRGIGWVRLLSSPIFSLKVRLSSSQSSLSEMSLLAFRNGSGSTGGWPSGHSVAGSFLADPETVANDATALWQSARASHCLVAEFQVHAVQLSVLPQKVQHPVAEFWSAAASLRPVHAVFWA